MLETPENLNTQAIELASQGYYKEAVACLNRAITIDKKNYLLWYNLGITYRDMGKQRDAKKAFLQAYELNYIDEDLLESLSLISFSTFFEQRIKGIPLSLRQTSISKKETSPIPTPSALAKASLAEKRLAIRPKRHCSSFA